MGRPKEIKGSAVWVSRGIDLTKEQENRLLDILGFDSDDTEEFAEHKLELILGDISNYLGTYNGAVKALDYAPRPAHYERDLGAINSQACDLLNAICELNDWMQDAIRLEGCNPQEFAMHLAKFVEALQKALREKSQGESRGNTNKQALRAVVNNLRGIFQKNCTLPEVDDPSDGRIAGHSVDGRTPSSREIGEEKFITSCLEYAGIFNSDQGSQFTAMAFTDVLTASGIRISMDGKGSYHDNIFTERLWRSVKYEEVYLKEYATLAEAEAGIAAYLRFYNEHRPHQALAYQTPQQVHHALAHNLPQGQTTKRMMNLYSLKTSR